MTGLKYLSDAETLMSSKRSKKNRSKSAHGSRIPKKSTATSSDAEHMNRILDGYRDLEDNKPVSAKLQEKTRQSPKPSSKQLQPDNLKQSESIASIVPQGVASTPELTVPSKQDPLDSKEQFTTGALQTRKTTPKLTLPSRQQYLARQASRRHARGIILPQESINRLSAIMEAEPPKSSERTVTMALSEIPPGLLSPTALNIAKEVPERLINFRVSFHPVLDVIGMSAEQAIHNGIALPVDALITPRTIAASDSLEQIQPQVTEDAPSKRHRWRVFGRRSSTLKQNYKQLPTTPLAEPHQESQELSKTVQFNNQDDVFDATPSISKLSMEHLGKERNSNATNGERIVMHGPTTEKMDTVQQAHNPKDADEGAILVPILPELDFKRASDNFESMFDKYQEDLRILVADMPDLLGVPERACSPDKEMRDDTRNEPSEDNIGIDVKDTLGYLPDPLESDVRMEDGKKRESGARRPDSFTLGIGERDVIMKPAPRILDHRSPRVVSTRSSLSCNRQEPDILQPPQVPGPPPNRPLPPLPRHAVVTKLRPDSKFDASQSTQQQSQQGSREWKHMPYSLPGHSKFLRPKLSASLPRAAAPSSSTFSSHLTGRSSKVHATRLLNLPQGLSASLAAKYSSQDLENPFLSDSPYPSIPALLRLHSTAVTPHRTPVIETSTCMSTYSPSSPRPLLDYLSELDTIRPIPDWSSSDSDTSEGDNTRNPADSVDTTENLEPAPLNLSRKPRDSHALGSALFSGSNDTPSDLSKGSDIDDINRQLNDLVTSEIDRLYHELSTNKEATDRSPIVRVGDNRRRPLLVEAPKTRDFSQRLGSDNTFNLHRHDKMGGCCSTEEARPSSSPSVENSCRSPSIISTGPGPMPFQELIAEFMPAQPIDIPPGDTALQARFRYTGDAIDPCNSPSFNRADSNSITQSSGTELFGVSNMSLSTRAGASDLDVKKAKETGIIGGKSIRNNDPGSEDSNSGEATNVLDKGKMVAPTNIVTLSRDRSPRSSIKKILSRYSVSDLRAAFPMRSDASLRAEYGKEPGTPEPPYYGAEYANHRMISKYQVSSSLDDTATFVNARQSQDDPFTGEPDRSNLMFSASGRIPQGLIEAHVREFANAENDDDGPIEGVVAASTPLNIRPHLGTIPPVPTRPCPLPPTTSQEYDQSKTKKASELIRELNLLASCDPEVSNLLRLSGFGGTRAPSIGSGTSSGATAAVSAPFLTSENHSRNPDIQGELLHQRDERARIERQERARQRLEKKASKATLKPQKSFADRSGLFRRFRRSSGSSGPMA